MRSTFCWLCLMLPALATADSVTTVDGSRLNGTVQALAAGKVVVETAYAGTITVDRSQVLTVAVDGERLVELASGERLVGTLARADDGGQVITTERFGAVRLEADAIAAVLPLGDDGAPGALDDTAVAAIEQAHDEEVGALTARIEQLESPWSGSVAVGMNGANGNSEEFNLLLRAEARRETEDDRFAVFGQERFAEKDDARTSNEFLLGGSIEHDFSPRSFVFGALSLEVDEFENLDLRAVLSGGYGYWFWEREDSKLKGLVGLGAQQENFDDGTSSTDALLELGYDYQRTINSTLSFTHNLRYFPTFEDPGEDFRVVVNFAADVNVAEAWGVQLGLRGDYNNTPPLGIDELDTSYFVNLLYKY